MKKIVLGLAFALMLFSCKKEILNEPQKVEQKPDFIDLPFSPKPPINQVLSGENVIFLDFDGQYVTGTNWNVSGPINAAPSTLNALGKSTLVDAVKEHYSTFDVIVTTDSTVYWSANPFRRIRCICTPTYQWYGAVGGVAFLHSFVWGSNEVCWTFEQPGISALEEAKSATHEIGHTLGLYHQCIWKPDCSAIQTVYNPGSGTGATGWAPTMGNPHTKSIWTFTVGHDERTNPSGCTNLTDEYAAINTAFDGSGTQLANKPDAIQNDISTDVQLGNGVAYTGSLEYPTDVDFFTIPSGHWSAGVTVATFGTTDIAVDVYNSSGVLKETVDPTATADISSTSVGGVIKGYQPKYIAVRNTSNNPNVPAGSLRGTYTITVTY